MKCKFNYLVIGLVISSYSCFSIADPLPAPLPDHLEMKTDVGKVVIEIAECPLKNIKGFQYKAYATDNSQVTHLGHDTVHDGCWKKVGNVVHVWFYNEIEPVVASYKDYHFKPETTQ